MISVIVPVYKVEPYLRRCVDSIIAQTYHDLEIILVDDGSPDNCGAICDEYAAKDSRVKVIHKENGGISSARNAGIDAANGEYVAFVDSDDWIDLNMYSTLLQIMLNNHADIAVCNYQFAKWKNNDSGVLYMQTGREAALNIINKDRMGDGISVSANDKLFARKCFSNSRFIENLYITEDTECMLRVIYNANRVIKLDETFYYYFQDSSSLMRSRYSTRKAYSEVKCYEFLGLFFHGKDNEIYSRITQMYSDKLFFHYMKCYQEIGTDFGIAAKEFDKKIRFALIGKTITFKSNKKAFLKHLLFCCSPMLYRFIIKFKGGIV